MTPIPLYRKGGHYFLRCSTLTMMALCGTAVIVISVGAAAQHEYQPLFIAPLFALIMFGVARTTLRAKPIFGSERGLWLRSPGGWTVIPWSDVDKVDYPASSFNPVFRLYTVEVKGQPPIYFLPDDEHLATIAEFRRLAE
jgi:hypothetical protein